MVSVSLLGAGSCLETLEKGKPLIVVINDKLMDNHQLELAKQLHRDGYVFYCNCRYGAAVAVPTGGEHSDSRTDNVNEEIYILLCNLHLDNRLSRVNRLTLGSSNLPHLPSLLTMASCNFFSHLGVHVF